VRDRGRDRLGIVGVHQQRSRAFGRRPSKARQDEVAGIVGTLGGDVFLGEQVHAVGPGGITAGPDGAWQCDMYASLIRVGDVRNRRFYDPGLREQCPICVNVTPSRRVGIRPSTFRGQEDAC
jgi:hypothetical protein